MYSLGVLLGLLSFAVGQGDLLYDPAKYPDLPKYGPQTNPPYMVDNQHNYFKVAPDKGEQNGPVWLKSGSLKNYMAHLADPAGYSHTLTGDSGKFMEVSGDTFNVTAAVSNYWLPQLAPLGKQPLAGTNYKFYRDVVKYGADNTGKKDATEAINAAIADGNRCGLECGNTFLLGAIIYFPPGTYKICRPVIQLYYTQFIGDALDPPTIKGCDTFQGIALFDTDPYIPGGNGQNWYINQNQFFRQIRNFIFDLTEMPLQTNDHDQPLVPTGIHWQVSQACSLQNLVFNMPKATDKNKATHVGIFMENGSGGFVSDLVFNGGNIGWRACSQQYTAMNIKFNGCLTAVQMIWDWGFNWQRIQVDGGAIAFNISGRGGSTGQGVGSVSIIDSKISNCAIAILTNSRKDTKSSPPNIVIDNLEMSNVGTTVKSETGEVILAGTNKVDLWAIGRRYNGYKGTYTSGKVDAPRKGSRLLDKDGKLFYRRRPQYEEFGIGQFLIATEHGCKNDGTGDNTQAINSFLQAAKDAGQIAYFPAGIYRVGSTVLIPTGSRVVGGSWSQIQGAGFYFNDLHNPRVVVQVGKKGDVGTMEIVDMMFTVQGATAGAIVLEWNVYESSQGSAAMWDSHVRIGGATGSDLDFKTCPKFGYEDSCICASLLFHVTPQASGYFENVWIWLADHDNDMNVYNTPDKISNQISLYAARGTLIESKGPSWFYGTGSEHTVLYQYQLYGAKDVYLGHIQTETPYFQPVPLAPLPFHTGKEFPGDPSFEKCKTIGCQEAWGLRIINSEGITLHSSGLYSFFEEYYQDCVPKHNCQEGLLEVRGSKDVALFNIFTVGVQKIGTGINNGAVFQNDSNQSGFTTEVSVWLPLPGDDNFDVVYVGTEVYNKPSVTCPANCILVFPTSSLASKTTIDPGKYTTSLEYGRSGTTTIGGQPIPTFFTTTTTVTLDINPITTDGIPYSNINITEGQAKSTLTVLPSVDIPPIPVPLPDGEGKTTTRNVTVPPWPDITRGPPGHTATRTDDDTRPGVYHTPYVTTISAARAIVTTISFPSTVSPIVVTCPPNTEVPFNTPKTIATVFCPTPTTISVAFTCPATKVVTFLGSSAGVFTVDCILSTTFSKEPPITTPVPTGDPTTTRPLPVWSTWPPRAVIPIEEEVDDPEPGKTPCNLWFFSICLNKGTFKGLEWILPPGVYPPGPPPARLIDLPPTWSIKPPLPPWPQITVGHDNIVTYPKQEPSKCEKKSASICGTTVFKTITTTGTITSTISSTLSMCDTIYGCSVSGGAATTTTTKTPDNCPLPTTRPKALQTGNADSGGSKPESGLVSAAGPPPPGCPADAVVYPSNPKNVGKIPDILAAYKGKYVEVKSESFQFTSFFWVPFLDQKTMDILKESPDVEFAYYYQQWNANVGPEEPRPRTPTFANSQTQGVGSRSNVSNVVSDHDHGNATLNRFNKRLPIKKSSPFTWDLSQISIPKGWYWNTLSSGSVDPQTKNWAYRYDSVNGEGQTVYLLKEDGFWPNHLEFSNMAGSIETLPITIPIGNIPVGNSDNIAHGSAVAAKAAGSQLGACTKCRIVLVPISGVERIPKDIWYERLVERILQRLIDVLEDIQRNNLQGKAVINMSVSFIGPLLNATFLRSLFTHLQLLEDQVQAVLVVTSGNKSPEFPMINDYPALFGNPTNRLGYLPNLIVVGATNHQACQAKFSQFSDWMTTFAPGQNMWVPNDPAIPSPIFFAISSGTSLAAPLVSGMIAYWRSLQSPWRDQLALPQNVKKMVKIFHRRIPIHNQQIDPLLRKPIIWNGQVIDHSCLGDYDTISQWDITHACPKINRDLSQETNEGETIQPCGPGTFGTLADGTYCPHLPDDGTGGHKVTFTTGATPAPTCPSRTGCGGHLCTGFYCSPNPTGIPPDHRDPKDPNASKPVPTRTIGAPPGPTNKPTITKTSGPEPTCDDRCKLDAGNRCKCSENGCDSESPSCCANASCPMCECGENGCSPKSPSCCASGTCEWSWTGGGGGDGSGKPPNRNPKAGTVLMVFMESLSQGPGGEVWTRQWNIFGAAGDASVDMCWDTPLLVADSNKDATGNKPGLPPKLPMIRTQGEKCSYTGTETTLGEFRCERGLSESKCQVLDPFPLERCPPLANPVMRAVVHCRWKT
ncbi:hypothetical protein GX48_00101 [Paracoccidioides brasiliensis]|nr:hypothetical protein GX48_00101 [Paracoccidioides brasiliensis]